MKSLYYIEVYKDDESIGYLSGGKHRTINLDQSFSNSKHLKSKHYAIALAKAYKAIWPDIKTFLVEVELIFYDAKEIT